MITIKPEDLKQLTIGLAQWRIYHYWTQGNYGINEIECDTLYFCWGVLNEDDIRWHSYLVKKGELFFISEKTKSSQNDKIIFNMNKQGIDYITCIEMIDL